MPALHGNHRYYINKISISRDKYRVISRRCTCRRRFAERESQPCRSYTRPPDIAVSSESSSRCREHYIFHTKKKVTTNRDRLAVHNRRKRNDIRNQKNNLKNEKPLRNNSRRVKQTMDFVDLPTTRGRAFRLGIREACVRP